LTHEPALRCRQGQLLYHAFAHYRAITRTLIARSFGASEWTDAFNVAFRLPNLLRRLFAEGAFSQAFVPILGEVSSKDDPTQSKTLINAVATLLFWALLLTVGLGIVGAPLLILAIATGFSGSPAYEASVVMTQIMFPYIGLISMVSLSAGILNTFQRFAIPAFTPVLLNLALIGSALWLAPQLDQPIYALAFGVLVGGVLQLAIQIPALGKLGLLPRIGILPQAIRSAWINPEARRVLKLMGPAVFAVSVAQISLVINTNIASRLQTGSVSWLSYADRLMEFPTALLGVALGTVLLPSLSRANAQQDTKQASELLVWGLQLTFLLAAPCAIALLLFGEPIAAVLYHYGRFTAFDVVMTQHALGRLWRWTDWTDSDQNFGAWILCPPRHSYTRTNCVAGTDLNPASQYCVGTFIGSHRPSAFRWSWRLLKCSPTVDWFAPTRRHCGRFWMG
jgi:putative peptidoglycan lipid II flippase